MNLTNNTQHTPGPWLIIGQNKVAVCAKLGEFTAPICTSVTVGGQRSTEEAQANARLIAAAPELLNALTMVLDADKDCKLDGLPTIPPAARATIAAAIAKATGEKA